MHKSFFISGRCELIYGETPAIPSSLSIIVRPNRSERNGVHSKSESYLSNYVKPNTTIDQLDLYHVMRAAGQVESLLGLTVQMKYDKPGI